MYLTRFYVLAAGLLSSLELVSAATVRHPRRSVKCYFETPAASGNTCESLASSWGIPVDLFVDINPGVTCPELQAGTPYCVIGDWTPDETSTSTASRSENPITSTSTTTQSSTAQSTTTSSSRSLTTTDSAIPSIYPTMPGIDENCDGFHMVKSGDQCDTIALEHDITVAQLKAGMPRSIPRVPIYGLTTMSAPMFLEPSCRPPRPLRPRQATRPLCRVLPQPVTAFTRSSPATTATPLPRETKSQLPS